MFTSTSLLAQAINRYIRLPQHGHARIIRHPLSDISYPGETFQFKYEVEPGKAMLHRIRVNFPEARKIASESDNLPNARNAMLLDELDREASIALKNPHLSAAADFPAFLPDMQPPVASEGFVTASDTAPVQNPPELPATTSVQIASEVITLPESATATSSLGAP